MLDRHGRVRYRGSINNLYAGFGKKRRVATEHYLRDAIAAVRRGKTPKTTRTKPIGCHIHYGPVR